MNDLISVLRRAGAALAAALVVIASASTSARAADQAPAPTNTTTATAAPAAAPATSGDKWRFVWHNNQWWYYLPNGQWRVHDGSAWHTPAAAAAVYRPAPSYSSRSYQPQPRYRQFMGSGRNGGGMSNDGFWGNSPRYWTYQHVLK